jgi:hypothetical protein
MGAIQMLPKSSIITMFEFVYWLGIKAPIEVKQTDAQLGLGKQTEYDKASSEATKERKKVP